MKKLLYTFLAVSIIFSACEEEDTAPNTNNNTTGTIEDVVGVWLFQGFYDATGNLESFYSIDVENCQLQTNITLQSDGNAITEWHYLENEVSGPCISSNQAFSFNYINSSTLQFILPTSCGNPTVTLNNPIQFKVPVCNGDNGQWEGDYSLFEKQ